jgi:hypothetical protein
MTATEHDPTDARRLRDACGAFATGAPPAAGSG